MKRKRGLNPFCYEKDKVCIFKKKHFSKQKKVIEKFYRNFGVIINNFSDCIVFTKSTNNSIIKYSNTDKTKKYSPLYLHIINYVSLSSKLLLNPNFNDKKLPSYLFVNCNEKTISKTDLQHINEVFELKNMDRYNKLGTLWDINKMNEEPSYCFIDVEDDYKKFLELIFSSRENMTYSYSMRPIFIFVNDITEDVDIADFMVKGISRNIYFVICPKKFDKYVKNVNGKICYDLCKFRFDYENDILKEVKINYPEQVIYEKENHKD